MNRISRQVLYKNVLYCSRQGCKYRTVLPYLHLPMLNLSCNLSTVGQMNADQYCLQSVKNYDYENFLSCLLLPDRCRGDIVALRAFNIELAQVGVTTTREPLAGLMRLQFWRDTLTAVHEGRSPQQPVAQLLHRVGDTLRCRRPYSVMGCRSAGCGS